MLKIVTDKCSFAHLFCFIACIFVRKCFINHMKQCIKEVTNENTTSKTCLPQCVLNFIRSLRDLTLLYSSVVKFLCEYELLNEHQ